MQEFNEWITGGYKYVGPGTTYTGDPVDDTDATAQRHDKNYLKEEDPYFAYNDADETFIEELKKARRPGTLWRRIIKRFAGNFFEIKKFLADIRYPGNPFYRKGNEPNLDLIKFLIKTYNKDQMRRRRPDPAPVPPRLRPPQDEFKTPIRRGRPPPRGRPVIFPIGGETKQPEPFTLRSGRKRPGTQNTAPPGKKIKSAGMTKGSGHLKHQVAHRVSSKRRRKRSKKSRRYRNLRQVKAADKGLSRRIAKIERLNKVLVTTLIYKTAENFRIDSSANQAAYQHVNGIIGADWNYMLQNLKFFNPSVPGTLITADNSIDTVQVNVRYYGKSLLILRNNYGFPVKLTVYLVRPLQASSSTVVTQASSAGTALGITTWETSLMHFLEDVKGAYPYKQYWKTLKKHKFELEGGGEARVGFTTKMTQKAGTSFETAATYAPKRGEIHYLVRISGHVAHDSDDTKAATEQGIAPARLDMVRYNNLVARYNGGASHKYYLTANSLNSFTNGAVMEISTEGNQSISS